LNRDKELIAKKNLYESANENNPDNIHIFKPKLNKLDTKTVSFADDIKTDNSKDVPKKNKNNKIKERKSETLFNDL